MRPGGQVLGSEDGAEGCCCLDQGPQCSRATHGSPPRTQSLLSGVRHICVLDVRVQSPGLLSLGTRAVSLDCPDEMGWDCRVCKEGVYCRSVTLLPPAAGSDPGGGPFAHDSRKAKPWKARVGKHPAPSTAGSKVPAPCDCFTSCLSRSQGEREKQRP